MFEFEFPWVFVLLPAPLLVHRLAPAYREGGEAVRVPFFERIGAALGAEPSRGGVLVKRPWFQMALAVLAWGLIVTALARPQFVEPPIEKNESTRDLLLAVDLSGSMSTRDMVDPEGTPIDRLTAVKLVLDDFISRREGDRIALVVFGTQAFVHAPFTLDHDLVYTQLDQTRPEMAGPQTALGDAIGLSIRAFESSEAEDRLLVLLTDGNDSGSKVPPRKAAEIASSHDVTIHTVAVGDPRRTGEAEIDEATLEAVASATGGKSFLADDRKRLEEIYREIDELAPVEVETLSYRPKRPLFHWPLGGSIVLVLLYQLAMGVAQTSRARRERHA